MGTCREGGLASLGQGWGGVQPLRNTPCAVREWCRGAICAMGESPCCQGWFAQTGASLMRHAVGLDLRLTDVL